MQFQNLGTNNH